MFLMCLNDLVDSLKEALTLISNLLFINGQHSMKFAMCSWVIALKVFHSKANNVFKVLLIINVNHASIGDYVVEDLLLPLGQDVHCTQGAGQEHCIDEEEFAKRKFKGRCESQGKDSCCSRGLEYLVVVFDLPIVVGPTLG